MGYGVHPDVTSLESFYSSETGQIAGQLVSRRLRMAWPNIRGGQLLGVGYATPFLSPFKEAERLVATMPASQGVIPWPEGELNCSALTEDTCLPFADRSFDYIIVCHALEHSARPQPFMRELWRVLTDNGRIIVIVPNRQGIWTFLDRTPFGSGRPYSSTQLSQLMNDTLFTSISLHPALFFPPIGSRVLSTWAQGMENVGSHWFSQFSGVLIIEACKQIYAVPRPEHAKVRHGIALGISERVHLERKGKTASFSEFLRNWGVSNRK